MEESESGINLQELSNDGQDEAEKKEAKEKEEREKQGTFRQLLMMKMKYWLVQGHDVFTIIAEILARSLANFYRQYADRHMNLKFVRRVSE